MRKPRIGKKMTTIIMLLMMIFCEGFFVWSLLHLGAMIAILVCIAINAVFGLVGLCVVDIVNVKE